MARLTLKLLCHFTHSNSCYNLTYHVIDIIIIIYLTSYLYGVMLVLALAMHVHH